MQLFLGSLSTLVIICASQAITNHWYLHNYNQVFP